MFGLNGHSAKRLHKIEIEHGAKHLGLTVDLTNLLLGTSVVLERHVADVADYLIGLVDTEVLGTIACENLLVLSIKRKIENIWYGARRHILMSPGIVAHTKTKEQFAELVVLALYNIIYRIQPHTQGIDIVVKLFLRYRAGIVGLKIIVAPRNG